MTSRLTHLRAVLQNDNAPAAVVAKANIYLANHSPDNMFASLWVAVYDNETNTLNDVDAEHGHWLITDEN